MRLTAPLHFRDDDGFLWTAPEGYSCDGASIPRPLWAVIGHPLYNGYRRASVLHDYLYSLPYIPRRLCDDLFRAGLRADGVGRVKARAMWIAVRSFGWACR